MEEAREKLEREKAIRRLQQIQSEVTANQEKTVKILEHVETIQGRITAEKRCFGWCPNWWWRYRLSKELEKKILPDILVTKVEIDELYGKVVGCPDVSTVPTIEFLSFGPKFMVSESSKTASRQIIEALKKDKVSLISLLGMGGVGKTTLVKEVGTIAEKTGLFDKVAMVTVSKNPNFGQIRDEIADYLELGVKDIGSQGLWMRLQREKKRRILIILDDVWRNINLKEEIGIPVGEGCKVLLTTRRHEVSQQMGCQEEIQLHCLNDAEAWTLFKERADLENCTDDAIAIKKVAREISKKCRGLPISINALGTALIRKTLAQWEATCQRLINRRLMDIADIDENTYLCLEASFDYVKDMQTKKCFLLCSLFPEDHEIYVEDLVRYAWGLDLYQDIKIGSIRDGRTQVLASVQTLKDSFLLLDSGENHVKMHDTVRDVALWISNRTDLDFVINSEVVEKRPKKEDFESSTAICYNYKRSETAGDDLPDGLVCPKLKILLLGNSGHKTRSSSAFFQGMQALQVCDLHYVQLSSRDAFQFQTNLRTLHLSGSGDYENSASLGSLKELRILSIYWFLMSELPGEIGNLSNLQLLDLGTCLSLRRIPQGLLRRLSQLEELYLDGCEVLEWATNQEASFASLSELNSLSKLEVLVLEVAPSYLPGDFVFPKLKRFDMWVARGRRPYRGIYRKMPIPKSLTIEGSAPLHACQQLYQNMESFHLKSFVGRERSLVGSLKLNLKAEVFNKLNSLNLETCEKMKCLIDTTSIALFSNLENLSLSNMSGLEKFCYGPQPQGFLQKLKTLSIQKCNNIISATPILDKLETMEVGFCNELQVLFQTEEEPNSPELRSIQHGPSHHVNLGSLKAVTVKGCNKLKYLFPASVAKGLGQLEKLVIEYCSGLEEIIQTTEASNICLGSLREVSVARCNSLTSLSSLSHGQVLASLTSLSISECTRLEYTFPFSMPECLPQLNSVYLYRLPQLKGTDGNDDVVLTLPTLQYSNVWHCPQLTHFIISSKKQGLEKSSLEHLKLSELPELRVILKGSIQVANFHQNLTQLDVHACKRLKYVLSRTIAANLPQLSSLSVQYCEGLEHIIEKDETSSQDHHLQQIIRFPNLTKIYISGCKNLKSLFPVSIAHSLEQLESFVLEFYKESKLEQVFEEEAYAASVSKADEDKLITLPQLDGLYLLSLPTMVSFGPVGYHFEFPSLRYLKVSGCPNITTRFSVDSNQCVHAKTEASQSIDAVADVMEESATWPIGSDIEWGEPLWKRV